VVPVAFALTGCSGIDLHQSVSPATFLVPGLIQAAPQRTPGNDFVPATGPSHPVAQVN
jgi:hypothetical protein